MNREKIIEDIEENGYKSKLCDDDKIKGIYMGKLIEVRIDTKDRSTMFILCPEEEVVINLFNSMFAVDNTIINAPTGKRLEDVIKDIIFKWR